MISRVIIFDDEKEDLERFQEEMKAMGCEVKAFKSNNSKQILKQEEIKNFKPQLAIVDSMFNAEIDGMDVVKDLNGAFPGIKIFICTILCDIPSKKKWVEEQYRDVEGVCAVVGKKPFPTGQQIIDLCNR